MGQTLAVEGLQDPSVGEFLNHPDYRQIAAFFLGWVSLYSLLLITQSKTLHALLSFSFPCPRARTSDLEARVPNPVREKTPTVENSFVHHQRLRDNEGHALFLMLALCFFSSSLAQFGSLFQFSASNGETVCAFVVAWGGMSGQAARLVALLILGRELNRLNIPRWEILTFWTMLVGALGLVFANNAISVGATRYVQPLHIYLCYKRHYMPTGLASSILLILLDIYVVVRTMMFIAPSFLKLRHQVPSGADFRVQGALSLLLLEGLTITSAAIFTNILVEFIPFSIGALIVLAVFNSPPQLNTEGSSIHLTGTAASSMHFAETVRTSTTGTTISIGQTVIHPSTSAAPDSGNSIHDTVSRYVDRHSATQESSSIRFAPAPSPLIPEIPQLPPLMQNTEFPRNFPKQQSPPTMDLPNIPPEGRLLPQGAPPTSSYRQILPSQAEFAEQFEQELSLPVPPPHRKQHKPKVSVVISVGQRDSNPESLGPLGSAILGSDIIRHNSTERGNHRVATRRYSTDSIEGTSMSALSPVSQDSRLYRNDSRSTRRVSFRFGRMSRDEAGMPGQDRSYPASRRTTLVERRNTFGPKQPSMKRLPTPIESDLSNFPPLAAPPGLSPRVRHPATPSGPRPLIAGGEPVRSPPPYES